MSDEQYKQLLARQLVFEYYLENLLAHMYSLESKEAQDEDIAGLLAQLENHTTGTSAKSAMDLAILMPEMLKAAKKFSAGIANRADGFRRQRKIET